MMAYKPNLAVGERARLFLPGSLQRVTNKFSWREMEPSVNGHIDTTALLTLFQKINH